MNILDEQFHRFVAIALKGIASSEDAYTVLGYRVWFDDRPEYHQYPWRIQHDVRIDKPFCKAPVGSIVRITSEFGAYCPSDEVDEIDWDEITWDDPRILAGSEDMTIFRPVNNFEDLACDGPDFKDNSRIFYTHARYRYSYPPKDTSVKYNDIED